MYAHHHATPGDAEEFCDLYKRYRPRLIRYCRQRLRGMGDPEDAAHEALLRALQAWSRVDRSVDAWPWLATIAARVCTDIRRRSARTTADLGHEPISDVHDLAVARLRASIIDDALDRLPVRYRNPLILKEYAGWSYRDIARLEGASVASVRSNIMRGRRYLGARVESVARSQGQWPLPAIVPRVTARARARSRRTHVARVWLERAAQSAAAAFDPSLILRAFASPAAHALASTAAVAGAAALSLFGGSPAPTPRSAQPGVPASLQAAPPIASASVSAAISNEPDRPLSEVKTVAFIDDRVPDNSVVGVGAVEVTAEFSDERMVIQVWNTLTWPILADDTRPQEARVSCTKDPTRPVVCSATKLAVEELTSD